MTLDKASYAPGAEAAVFKLEANCSVGQPCNMVTLDAVCSMSLTANGQKWSHGGGVPVHTMKYISVVDPVSLKDALVSNG